VVWSFSAGVVSFFIRALLEDVLKSDKAWCLGRHITPHQHQRGGRLERTIKQEKDSAVLGICVCACGGRLFFQPGLAKKGILEPKSKRLVFVSFTTVPLARTPVISEGKYTR
jgi:hypothetical protein